MAKEDRILDFDSVNLMLTNENGDIILQMDKDHPEPKPKRINKRAMAKLVEEFGKKNGFKVSFRGKWSKP